MGCMLLVLGLLSTEEAWEILVCWAVIVTAAIVCIVHNVSPWDYAAMMMKALCILVAFKVLPGWLIYCMERARDDVHESWDEVQDLGVVGEGQVVGEPRRLEHTLIAKVWMGSLGTLSLTLESASRHR